MSPSSRETDAFIYNIIYRQLYTYALILLLLLLFSFFFGRTHSHTHLYIYYIYLCRRNTAHAQSTSESAGLVEDGRGACILIHMLYHGVKNRTFNPHSHPPAGAVRLPRTAVTPLTQRRMYDSHTNIHYIF